MPCGKCNTRPSAAEWIDIDPIDISTKMRLCHTRGGFYSGSNRFADIALHANGGQYFLVRPKILDFLLILCLFSFSSSMVIRKGQKFGKSSPIWHCRRWQTNVSNIWIWAKNVVYRLACSWSANRWWYCLMNQRMVLNHSTHIYWYRSCQIMPRKPDAASYCRWKSRVRMYFHFWIGHCSCAWAVLFIRAAHAAC